MSIILAIIWHTEENTLNNYPGSICLISRFSSIETNLKTVIRVISRKYQPPIRINEKQVTILFLSFFTIFLWNDAEKIEQRCSAVSFSSLFLKWNYGTRKSSVLINYIKYMMSLRNISIFTDLDNYSHIFKSLNNVWERDQFHFSQIPLL